MNESDSLKNKMKVGMFELESKKILWDADFGEQSSIFECLSDELIKSGHVLPGFLKSLAEREDHYPTGLPTQPYSFAMPHTDPEYIINPFIYFVMCKNFINWKEMGSEEETLQVRLVVLLGLNNELSHLNVLQNLIESLSNFEFNRLIHTRESKEAFISLLNSEIFIEE